jgi:hypothetical protein
MKPKINSVLLMTVFAVIMSSAVSAYAWNIVCGVSINFTGPCSGGEGLLARQYDVDSKLLKGISAYYSAASELQLVDIDKVKAGRASKADLAHIAKGQSDLQTSLANMRSAVKAGDSLMKSTAGGGCNFVATDRATGKETLQQAAKFVEIVEALVKSFSAKTLPSVDRMHAALEVTQQITQAGMKLSVSHLGMEHHSAAGEEIKFK